MTSPPSDVPEFRGQTLTPISPKPVHYPSPSNIPILEKQMDPIFNDTSTHIGHSSNYQPMAQHTDTPDKSSSSDSMYADQEDALQSRGGINVEASAVSNGDDEYLKSLEREDADNQHNQDTPIQSFTQPTIATAGVYSESASAPTSADHDHLTATHVFSQTAGGYLREGAGNGADLHAERLNMSPTGSLGNSSYQILMDKLIAPKQISEGGGPAPAISPTSQIAPAPGTAKSPVTALLGNPNLPPRPPPQEKPATHPNYAPGDDIRSYHPHSQKTPGASYRTQSGLPPLVTGSNGLPAPPVASFQQQPVSASQRTASPLTPNYRQRDAIDRRSDREGAEEEDSSWGTDIQKIYDQFIQDERNYVTEGQWDKFPPNSRLFIGNLPTEKVKKQDLFQIFHKHGKLAQISIKQAYGFVQFLNAESCYRALQAEQGMMVRGRKMHLEISKPQKNSRADGSGNARGGRRRSRSPDYTRGGGPRGVDRYTGGQDGSPRDRDFRRGRDDYRPGRSPSPRSYRGRGRDRSRDHYDGRRRSRSRSPYSRSRYRGASPRPSDLDDDLPLPRRNPRDVPDVQIIVLDSLDRAFIHFVERAFQDRGVRCDVLLLSPRLSEAAVVRRQILEGVLAVSKLTQESQNSGRIPLQVFDRSAGQGNDNVNFDQYENLQPLVCAELVLRQKQKQALDQNPQYGLPPPAYGLPPAQYGLPSASVQSQASIPGANSDLSSLLGSLDQSTLHRLLGSVQPQAAQTTPVAQQQTTQPQSLTTGLTPELTKFLQSTAASSTPAQQPAYSPSATQAAAQQSPYTTLSGSPALASLFGGSGAAAASVTPQQPSVPAAPQTQPTTQPDVQEIMAQLAKYNRR